MLQPASPRRWLLLFAKLFLRSGAIEGDCFDRITRLELLVYIDGGSEGPAKATAAQVAAPSESDFRDSINNSSSDDDDSRPD